MPTQARSNSSRVLELEHATKAFAGVHALEDVSTRAPRRRGTRARGRERGRQVDARQDPRAASTSPTLARCSSTARRSCWPGPAEARDTGIAVIYQEPTLFPDLYRGRERLHRPPAAQARTANRPRGRCTPQVTEIFERLGVRLDPDRIARGLSIAEQQLVEIAKALSLEAKCRDHGRADRRAVRRSRSSGCSAWSRRCARTAPPCCSSRTVSDEVFDFCQRVTVLRDGRLVLSQAARGTESG